MGLDDFSVPGSTTYKTKSSSGPNSPPVNTAPAPHSRPAYANTQYPNNFQKVSTIECTQPVGQIREWPLMT